MAALACGASALAAEPSAPAGSAYQVDARGTVSLSALAASAANVEALRSQHQARPVAVPLHRFPDGALVRKASALPLLTRTTADVRATPNLNSPPTKIQGFTGITDGSNATANSGGELEPPDQGLAVGGGYIVEIVNNAIQVFSLGGKALSNPLANATFFNTADNLSDPHAVYDPTVKRWFIEELDYSSSFNGFEVAVSQTSDPLGSYYVYKISALTENISACGGSCLPDYPQVGFDKNGFYIAADLFSNTSGNFVNAAIYALPKSILEQGSGFTYVYFQTPDFVVQPSQPAPGTPFVGSAGGTEYLMSARNIYDGSTNVRVFALSETAKLATSAASLRLHSVDVAAESYTATVPSTEPNDVGPYGKSQGATSSPKLDGGYNAFGGGVKYANGKLYTALTTGSSDANGLARDVVAYFVVTPTTTEKGVTASIAAQGYVTLPTGYSLSYPGLAIDKSGNGIIGGTVTNPSASAAGGYPSTGFIEFQNSAPTGSFYITGVGAASDDGFTGYSGSTAVTGRWGDYASAQYDATSGHYFTGNEYIPNASRYPRGTYANWGTFITQVH